MNILILTGLVVIIVILAFIAVMIWGIGEHLSKKQLDPIWCLGV